MTETRVVTLQVTSDVPVVSLAEYLVKALGYDGVVALIDAMDEAASDWDLTKMIHEWSSAQMREYEAEGEDLDRH